MSLLGSGARRRAFLAGGAVVVVLAGAWGWAWLRYPSDRTPEGAYLRVMSAVNLDRPQAFFAYLETPAQHACFTIGRYRREARDLILASYPEPERTRLAEAYAAEALAPDGADVFAHHARRHGWLDYLRRDLSGVARVEIAGERATVETVGGTRYPFRLRDNGIWGLTLFTARLDELAVRAARDADIVRRGAADHERARRARADAQQ